MRGGMDPLVRRRVRGLIPPLLAAALPASALLAGCARGPGDPMGVLEAELEAALVIPDDRDLGGGWQRLDSGFEVRIEELVLEAGPLELVALGEGSAAFDPADPPPGYSNCHGGHCHADDGRLISYEEIAAELGGGAGPQVVLALPVGELDLAAGAARPLDCAGPCDLPRADIGLLRLPVLHLEGRGQVRDGAAEPRLDGEVPWTLALDLEHHEPRPALADRDIVLEVDRDEDPAISLRVSLALSGALFEHLAWDELAAGRSTIELAGDEEVEEEIAEELAEQPLTSRVERGSL